MLILDEPANGLDPAGIRWMRDLLRGYADRGATVLLSSTCSTRSRSSPTTSSSSGNGRIVAQGTKAELLAAAGTQVRTRHPDQLDAALTIAGLTYTDATPPTGLAPTDPAAHPAGRRRRRLVGHLAHRGGVALIELRAAEGAGLEEMFLELTADTQRDRDTDPAAIAPSIGAVA